MDIVEIIVLVIGVVLTLVGYIYNKVGLKQKTNIPDNYKEYIGICKKHVEKKGEFYEVFEIVHDGRTLKYNFPPQSSKDQLREIDSIEKFYIDEKDPDAIKTASDFNGKKTTTNNNKRYLSYVIAGAGLICIAYVLIKLAFIDLK